jgi:hypothetical protein
VNVFIVKRKAAAALAVVLAVCMAGYAAMYPAIAYEADRPLPIYCVEKTQKVCSISFDAAWGDVRLRQMSAFMQ